MNGMNGITVSVCSGKEFDWQMAIDYQFENWDEASKFILLSLENDLIVQVQANKD